MFVHEEPIKHIKQKTNKNISTKYVSSRPFKVKIKKYQDLSILKKPKVCSISQAPTTIAAMVHKDGKPGPFTDPPNPSGPTRTPHHAIDMNSTEDELALLLGAQGLGG